MRYLANLFKILIVTSSILFCIFAHADAQEWKERKGDHFIVYYDPSLSYSAPKDVLRKAEMYYDSIAREIGYSRYSRFWAWDSRVKIYLYKDKESFLQETGLPSWTKGAARVHRLNLKRKDIVTYWQEEGFLDGTLPHEIGHLILKDFIGPGVDIPIWFEEGVAQLFEVNKRAKVNQNLLAVIVANKNFSLEGLTRFNVRRQKDPFLISVFYLQSLSTVDYLIDKFGSLKFADLCLQIKDGKSFSQALYSVYHPYLDSIGDLEKKWLRYVTNN